MTSKNPPSRSAAWTAPRGARLVMLLVLLSAYLLACRGRDTGDGAGGQSGDEGRRSIGSGTGGVTSELRLWR